MNPADMLEAEIAKGEENEHRQNQAMANALGSQKARHPMEALLRSGTMPLLKVGDIVEGSVLEKRGGKLFVDLGSWGTGIVYGREYYAADELIKGLKENDLVSAKVVDLDNDEGYKELSLQEAGREKRWRELKRMKDEGVVIELPVQKANTGGLILQAMGVEGFLPASQLSHKNYPRVEGGDKERIFQELQKLVGKPLRLRILDLDPNESKLIFTEKGLSQEAIREAVGRCKVGDVVEGTVTGVVDFGAFVKFYPGDARVAQKAEKKSAASLKKPDADEDDDETGSEENIPAEHEEEIALEGLVHLSEIDWSLVSNPRDVLKTGDNVTAKIIEIQGDKISLSLKQLKEDPWVKAGERYHKGEEIEGTVTRLNPFGAFVEVEKDIQGLAHVSEFGTEANLRHALSIGKPYRFTILLMDPKEHRMSLTLAGKTPEPEAASEEK